MSVGRLDENDAEIVTPADEAMLRRALQLSRRTTLPNSSMDALLASIPNDWQPGDSDVDEFLNSIRGRSSR